MNLRQHVGWLSRLTLRRKLILAVEFAGLAGILFASLALLAHQSWNLRTQFRIEMQALAEIVANYVIAPVSFGDERGMKEALAVLAARPEVVGAELQQPDGKVLVRMGEALPVHTPVSSHSTATFDGWLLTTSHPLELPGERLGVLRVRATFQPVLMGALRSFVPALVAIVVLSCLGLAVTTRLMVRVILAGLNRLTDSASRIASTRDYSVRATVASGDEVGRLAVTFNHMLDQLQATDQTLRGVNASLTTEIAERKRLERELVESSRVAGMAEVATDVLHNVGNVLNSVNVSTQLLREQIESSQVKSLHELADLVRPHAADPRQFLVEDPRAPVMVRFLVELSTCLLQERRNALEELQSLGRNVEHVKEIVSAQQSFARTVGVLEMILLEDLMEDALRINASSLSNHRVTIIRDFAPEVRIETDRHKALQILVNLISNAIHAVKACDFDARRVHLAIRRIGDAVELVVRDSGVGIAADHLTRIFQHGFTTRKEGHGFGLHSGALAARSLGGQLHVASEGLGHGATFTLQLPARKPVAPSRAPIDAAVTSSF